MVKHDKIESINFKKKESHRCKHCGKQASKGSNVCMDCREQLYCKTCTHLKKVHTEIPHTTHQNEQKTNLIDTIGFSIEQFSSITRCANCSECTRSF